MPAWDDVVDDLKAVWSSPQITVGRYVKELEALVAERLDVPHMLLLLLLP